MNLTNIIEILIIIESGGDWNAVGDGGDSWGGLQIQAAVVLDVNRVYKTEYVHEDAFNREKAIDICIKYLTHYGRPSRFGGRVATEEEMVRMWNGGPRGHKKRATEKYWKKYQRAKRAKREGRLR